MRRVVQTSNTLFLTFFCVGSATTLDMAAASNFDVAGMAPEVVEHVLRTAFTTLPIIDHVVLLTPSSAQLPKSLQVRPAPPPVPPLHSSPPRRS